jgi:hypothetical protein
MRYMLAMILALVLGIPAAVPAAFAADREGGHDSYVSTATMQSEPGDPGTIAGPMGPNQFQIDDRGHDRT